MIVAVVQARCSSTRLPGKVLLPLLGRPMICRLLERVRRARRVDRVVVATSREASDDELAATVAAEPGVAVHRGDLQDVLGRVWAAATAHAADHVVRLTGDCPLVDPEIVDRVVAAHLERGADYTSNTLRRTWPDGLDVEVVRMAALAAANREASLPSEREHVTPFLYGRPERFALHGVECDRDLGALRWVVDHPVDFEVVVAIFARLHPGNPAFGMREVLDLMAREPDLFARNAVGEAP